MIDFHKCLRAYIILILLSISNVICAQEFQYGECTYRIISPATSNVEGKAILVKNNTQFDGPFEVDGYVLDDKYNVYTVIDIGDNVFEGQKQLTSLILNEPLIHIGKYAFHDCSNLRSVEFPEGLIDIGEKAFLECDSLETINLPSSLESIRKGAFQCTNIKSLTLPKNLRSVSTLAFSLCQSLRSVSIPPSIEVMEDSVFLFSSHIRNVDYLTDNFKKFPPKVFERATYFVGKLTVPPGCYPAAKATDPWAQFKHIYEKDQKVTKLELDQTEVNCDLPYETRLTATSYPVYADAPSITWSSSNTAVATVDTQGWVRAVGRGSATITAVCGTHTAKCVINCSGYPKYKTFWSGAFNYTITSDENYTVQLDYYNPTGRLEDALTVPTSVSYMNHDYKVTSIAPGAFQASDHLYRIDVPEQFTEIDARAFAYCKKLTTVVLHNKLTKIGHDAFNGCESLTELIIPESVKSVEHDAFSGCTNLRFVSLPPDLEFLGRRAFSGCSNLKKINYVTDSPVSIEDFKFFCPFNQSVFDKAILYLGKGGYENAIKMEGWSKFCDIREKGQAVTELLLDDIVAEPDDTIQLHHSFAPIYAEDKNYYYVSSDPNVATVGPNNTLLIKNPGKITLSVHMGPTSADCDVTIKRTTFDFKVDNMAYNITSSANHTVEVAYYKNYEGDIVVPQTVTYNDTTYTVTALTPGAFKGCANVTSIDMPVCFTEISKEAFSGCHSLESFKVPMNVTSIDSKAFYDCHNLREIELPSNMYSIGEAAFGSCTALQSINLPYKIDSIGEFAFIGCRSLTSIKFPPIYYHKISKGTFSGCSNLTEVVLPDRLTEIDNYAFYNCKALKNIQFSSNLLSIGDYAYANCSSLQDLLLPETVTSIGHGAFQECRSIRSINIPAHIQSIGKCAYRTGSDINTILYVSKEPIYLTKIEDAGILDIFKDNTYENTKLIVETNKRKSFMKSPLWGKFKHIQENGLTVKGISITPEEWEGSAGDEFNISASVYPPYASNPNVTYTSSDEDVATVDDAGNVTIVNDGTCTITVEAVDGSEVKAECQIYCVTAAETVPTDLINSTIDVYDLKGQALLRNADSALLKSLSPGTYIIDNNGKRSKLFLR